MAEAMTILVLMPLSPKSPLASQFIAHTDLLPRLNAAGGDGAMLTIDIFESRRR